MKRGEKMPEISRFFGITISMYADDHNPPHFHAEYNGQEAQFDLRESAIIKGFLPSKQARFIIAWAEIHKEELLENWENLLNGKGINKINPLS